MLEEKSGGGGGTKNNKVKVAYSVPTAPASLGEQEQLEDFVEKTHLWEFPVGKPFVARRVKKGEE